MPDAIVLPRLTEGTPLARILEELDGLEVAGARVAVAARPEAVPYLDHEVAGWVDGPPSSDVAAIVSGRDPAGAGWRRFVFSRTGPGRYELAVFPTPFHNPRDPLAPGMPPSTSRHD